MFGNLKYFINNATVKENELFLKNNIEGLKKGSVTNDYKKENKMFEELKEFRNEKMMGIVANMLGKKLHEEFNIEEKSRRYRLTENGLEHYEKFHGWDITSGTTLQKLLTGELEIGWTPREGEEVWVVYSDVKRPIMRNFHSYFKLLLKRGFIFRTEEEGIQDMKDRGWL